MHGQTGGIEFDDGWQSRMPSRQLVLHGAKEAEILFPRRRTAVKSHDDLLDNFA